MTEVGEISSRGWTQGSLLRFPSDSVSDVELEPDVQYCIISHPCDVVSSNLERDPFVELIPTQHFEAPDGNLVFGKNARRLHLPHDGSVLELNADAKFKIDRMTLATINPSGIIDETQRTVLSSWLSSRYARPAFADEFNLRMAPATKGISKIVKAGGAKMSGIYVGTSMLELDEATPYSLTVVITMLAEDFEDPIFFATVSEASEKIEAEISKTKGIDLESLEVFSEDGVSLDALRRFARWDYDDLSLRAGDESTLPARH